MSEKTQRWDKTLDGMGPIRDKAALLSHDAVGRYRRQNQRYDWFARQVQADGTIDLAACHRVLSTPLACPGRLERAMVGLSLSDDPVAMVILDLAISPGWNEGLTSFHRICVHRCLRCNRGPSA